MVTEQAILEALSTVNDPDLHKGLVSLGMIRDLRLSGPNVSFEVVLTTPACPLKARIERDCREALQRVPGIGEITVRWGAQVVAGRASSGPGRIPGVTHTIAVASGKGGVGKSTVSVNLAVALAETGAKVGLLDADIYGPSIPLMMGVHRPPQATEDNRIVPLEAHGVKLMSFGFLLPDHTMPVVWRGPMVAKALGQFLHDVNWGNLDYLLVDLPPGTGDAQLTLSQSLALSGVVIVTTPQDLARTIAGKVLLMFRQVQVPILGIVENMGTFLCPTCHEESHIFSAGGGRKASEALQAPLLGEIPLDLELCEGGDEGRPVLVRSPGSPAADIFRRLAGALAARVSVVSLDPAAMAGHPLRIVPVE
jgi:ATP-binding protein involved in chromosome partitioning